MVVGFVAAETLFDLELQRGQHTEIIPELTEFVEYNPLNERFCEQLMVALYRSGRQTEALYACRRMRQRLDAEPGVAPSPDAAQGRARLCVPRPGPVCGR
jgi:DNA-binding SARP family transcriptional activator